MFYKNFLASLITCCGLLAPCAASIKVEGNVCNIDGVKYPAVGFGTCMIHGNGCKMAVAYAAEAGYRIIDTATIYQNFMPIGQVVNQWGRQNFYIISKVWHDETSPKDICKDLQRTLSRLKTTYIDAYLIHWPNSQIPIEQTLRAMDKLRQQKKIRHIGISNPTVNHLKRALEVGVPIAWVQVEMHPHFCDFALLKFCQEKGVAIQAYCPLDRGRVHQNELLAEIGRRYGKAPEQVALKWIVQHGCVPLPCSSKKLHIQQNMDINNFMLTAEEMQAIDGIAATGSRRGTRQWGLPFHDEFDYSYEQCWPKR